MKKVAFLTTIFPIKKEYLYDFFNSLKNQTYKKFDLIVVNDGYKSFNAIKNEYKDLNIIELKYSSAPAKNREYGINYCIDNNYDILIFGDSDDYFSDNRVKKSLELLQTNDIVINDLSLFDGNSIYEEKYISNRIKNGTIVDMEFIKDKNIFGLTNTAINLQKIEKVIFNHASVAVDNFFFKTLLAQGLKAIFTNKTVSYYRQHPKNTLGLNKRDGLYLLWGEEK